MATQRQKKANRKNAKKGGPKSKKGKEVVRTNARKHGIFAAALTEFDEDELAGIYDELVAWFRPAGPVEKLLIEKLAHTYLRLQRCARAEAEYHIRIWEPRWDSSLDAEGYVYQLDTGRHASWFGFGLFARMIKLFARYDQTLTNQLIKLLHEIERVQRMRLGDNVPPPVVADVTVHAVTGNVRAPGGALTRVADVPAADYTGTGIRACNARSREVPVSG